MGHQQMFFPYKYVRASSAYKTYLFCMLLSSARINLKTSRNLYKNDSFLNEWLTTLEPIDFNNKWALNGVLGAHPTPRPPSLHPPSPTHHKESVIDMYVTKHRVFCVKTQGFFVRKERVFVTKHLVFVIKQRVECVKAQSCCEKT